MRLFYIDLFCGAGGVTTGVIRGGGKVIACINHDPLAIQSHKANHRGVLHFTEDIRSFDLTRLIAAVALIRAMHPDAVICLWASLECTHFSKAKGGESRDADSRTLAEHLYRYIKAIDPDYIDIENVVEFMSWGPLRIKCAAAHKDRSDLVWKMSKQREFQYCWVPDSKKNGKDYVRWYQHICREYGYDYDYRVFNAADFGARTSRVRYFGQFKKPHLPFTWPAPTHSKSPTKDGMFKGLRKWKPVRPALDLKDEGKSIFGRKKDLSPNTYKRIYAGLIKYVGEGKEPAFITKWMSDGVKNIGLSESCVTITTMNHLGVIQPEFLLKYNSTNAKTGKSKPVDVNEPAPTVAAQPRLALVTPEFLSKYFSGDPNSKNIPIDGPCGTIKTKDSHALVFLAKYYGSGGQLSGEGEPAGTLTTKDRMAVIWLDKHYSGPENHQSVEQPAGAILTKDKYALVWLDKQFRSELNHQDADRPSGAILPNDKHCLMMAQRFIMNQFSGGGTPYPLKGGNSGKPEPWLVNHTYDNEGSPIDKPSPTLLASRKHFYLMNPQFNNKGKDIDSPCFTLIAIMDKKPPYLVEAETGRGMVVIYEDDLEVVKKIKLFMAAHGIVDIKMRMLKVPELLKIQGFGERYQLKGNQSDQKRFIGNSVPPLIVRRMVEARKLKLEEMVGRNAMVA